MPIVRIEMWPGGLQSSGLTSPGRSRSDHPARRLRAARRDRDHRRGSKGNWIIGGQPCSDLFKGLARSLSDSRAPAHDRTDELQLSTA